MLRISAAIDRINDGFGTVAKWLTLLLVLNVTFDVVTRYAFNFSIVASQEMERHGYSLIFPINPTSTNSGTISAGNELVSRPVW